MTDQLVKKQIMMKLYSYRILDKKKFGIAGDLTFEDIQELFKRQEGKCYVCEDLLLASGFQKLCKYQISVDRLNNSLPHERTNVLLSCYYCNCAEYNGWTEKCCECHPEPREIVTNRYDAVVTNPELTKLCLPYRNEERKDIIESYIEKLNLQRKEREEQHKQQMLEQRNMLFGYYEKLHSDNLQTIIEAGEAIRAFNVFDMMLYGEYTPFFKEELKRKRAEERERLLHQKKEEKERILKLQLEDYERRQKDPLVQLRKRIRELQAQRKLALINGTWSEDCELEKELDDAKAKVKAKGNLNTSLPVN
jgi:hypothetical protein